MLMTAIAKPEETTLDPSLARALRLAAQVSPRAAGPMRGALLAIAADASDWQASTLTGRGTPVELAFTSTDTALRFTAEVTPPDVSPAGRLKAALARFAEVAGEAVPHRLAGRLRRWQRSGTPVYGAWLSGRFDAGGGVRTKLYGEVPADMPDASGPSGWETALLGPPVLRGALSMVGWESPTRRLELYFEARRLSRPDVTALLRRVALEARGHDLLDALSRLAGRAVGERLPEGRWGFSYALDPAGRPATFTLYTFADTLFSSDANIRRAILGRARAEGFDADLYERVSEPLRERHNGDHHHGMLGVTVAADGPPVYSWGLAPPREPTRAHERRFRVDDRSRRPSLRRVLGCQSTDGAFPSFVTVDGTSHVDTNAFTTALVIDALDSLPATPEIHRAVGRALDFLERCLSNEHPGAYHFYPPGEEPSFLGATLPADVDDTALALLALHRHGRVSRHAARQVVAGVLDPFRLHWRPESTPRWIGPGAYRTWLRSGPRENQVDACVNANMASLLSALDHRDHPAYSAARRTVLRGLEQSGASAPDIDRLIPYYAHPAELVHALERGAALGVEGFGAAADSLRRAGIVDRNAAFDRGQPLYRSPDGRFVWTSPVLQAARELRLSLANTSSTPKGTAS